MMFAGDRNIVDLKSQDSHLVFISLLNAAADGVCEATAWHKLVYQPAVIFFSSFMHAFVLISLAWPALSECPVLLTR